MMRALDLFSAAAGGWTLGLHRAGFITIAACEIVEWWRILYAENNPHVRLYDDVRSLTGARLVSDLGILQPPCGHDADACEAKRRSQVERPGDREGQAVERREGANRHAEPLAPCSGNPTDADGAGQPDGRLESGLRPAEIPDHGCGDGRGDDGSGAGQMDWGEGAGGDTAEPWADGNGLAHHLLLGDGISAWLVGTRLALGGPRGTAAASLIVEAFGDAVLPQIPEAIGRAILGTEAALDAVLGRSFPDIPGNDR